jgi:hypothetical protein
MAPPLRRDPRSNGNNRGEGLTERAIVKVNPEVNREYFSPHYMANFEQEKTFFLAQFLGVFLVGLFLFHLLYDAVFTILTSSSLSLFHK